MKKMKKLIVGILAFALIVTAMPGNLTALTAYAAEGADGQAVHVYAQTPGDVQSDKYELRANGTAVPVIRYNANGNNFDIARFSSDDATPEYTVTLPNEEIRTVSVYPERYYPQSALKVDETKHTLTFTLSENLRYVIVMINGGPADQSGKPYLAIINDPVEKDKPDVNGSNVLNFKTFSEQYLREHPNTQTAVSAGITSGGVSYDAGEIVASDAGQVRFPNLRRVTENDVSAALQAALDEIYKENSPYDTLYFPAGEYLYSGLEIRNRNGKHVNIYVEEGALLKNRIQECMQAMEPAIGIWDSSDITISGRGIFDGNGVANYRKDRHDAKDSCHQGGVMVVRSSGITFNDTYIRDAKQWNWETHTAKNCTFNNIKGLTPYSQPWVDGLDFASGQNLTVNGAFTLGNDDLFASGHYNPSDGFTNMVAGFDQYNSDSLAWDTEDSSNISINNTLGWSCAGGNGIRLGHNTYGHKMKAYSFNNLNAVNFQGGGNGITVQNGLSNKHSYPGYESLTFKNCSFDTTRVGNNININGLDSNNRIQDVTVENCWFSKAPNYSGVHHVDNLTVRDLYMGGSLVEWTSQTNADFRDDVVNLIFTANGNEVRENSLPTFTSPEGSIKAYTDNPLIFTVKAEDSDEGDEIAFRDADLSSLEGASFDRETGRFSWIPTEEYAGQTYDVTFTAVDRSNQPVDYTVKITVNSSKNGEKSYTVAEDAHMQTWKTEKNSNYGSSNFLTAGLIKNNGLLGEKFTSTNTNDGTDGKMIFLKFDLSEMKQEKGTYDSANLTLTYICRRGNNNAGADVEDQLNVVAVDDSSWDEKSITWNTKPVFEATEDTVKRSEAFKLEGDSLDQSKFGTNANAAINGKKVSIDIKDLLDAALEKDQDYLTLAVCETYGTDVYFVSREGAAFFRNATPDMAPSISLNIPTELEISGPEALTLATGYEATETDSFMFRGNGPFDVTVSGNDKVTWDASTQQLKIAEGIRAGEYPIILKVKNENNVAATHIFILTVTNDADTTELQKTFDAYKDVEQGNYSDQSYALFSYVRTMAENALKDGQLNQKEIDAVCEALKRAAENLQENVFLKKLVVSAPNQTAYTVGEALNTEGMKAYAVYSDGTVEDVAALAEISGYDASKIGKQTITVHYAGQEDVFSVQVQKKETPDTTKNPENIVLKEQTITTSQELYKAAYKAKAFSLNAKAEGALTYVSGNTKVAGVDKDGTVTPKGYGKTTIVLIADGTSEYKTAVKEVTVTVVPAKVTGVSASNKKAKQLTVKWKKNKNVSGYQIQYAANKSFAKAKTVKVSSTKAVIRKLKKGKKYYIRVRAYKSINGEKFVGSWSKAKVKKVK